MSMQRPTSQQNNGGPMRGPMGAMGRPVEKAKDFQGTARRLLGYFVPQKHLLLIVLGAAISGCALWKWSC